ncbi:cytochrome c oxidase subunit 4 [Corynebacterium sp. H128]|uniref:aa3-type cytochrome oxidase subunit IV n=1 Tax=unclassified Corynebacterium TaxID=2624378 RepID=UPI00309E4900
MKSSAKIMYGLAAFLVVVTIVYIVSTMHVSDAGNLQGMEWAGGTGLVLATGLCLMLGGYFHFTERRLDVLPEDWEQAEVEDGTGMLGFFSPGSVWPAVMSGAIAVLGFGIVYMHYWLIAFGAVLLIWSGTMLNLQYGIPKEKH